MPEDFHLKTNRGEFEIRFYSARIARVRVHPKKLPPMGGSEMCVLEPDESVRVSRLQEQAAILLDTGVFRIRVGQGEGAFEIEDPDGRPVAATNPAHPFVFEPVEVFRTIMDENSLESLATADGERVQAQVKRTVFERFALRARVHFEWAGDEALYGLGMHEEDHMNLRGTMQYLYQHNRKVSVPVLLSTRGYGVVFHTEGALEFHDDARGSFVEIDVTDVLDFFVVYGPSPDQVVAGIRQLTGTVPMMPRWLFGYCQSKERYKTQEEIVTTAREFRRRGVPIDLIVQDWFYWPDGWGGKHFDAARYPDPTAMCEAIHAEKMKVMISIWPNMMDSQNRPEMIAAGGMLNDHSIYNAFDEQARALYWKQAREGIFRHGFDAWWCDSTEPYIADWQGATVGTPAERAEGNIAEFKRHIDAARINAYTLYHSKGIYEHQRAEAPQRRVVNLTRSSYLGQPRYGTIAWPGDPGASWATLRQHIPALLNYSATGQPYCTMDIGGFFVKRGEQWFWDGQYDGGVEDLGYRELYVRWFQYGAFLPMFRSHGTDTPREPWHFGEPGTPFFDALMTMLRLRYRLLPYIYSLAGWITQRHATMHRPLAFDFVDDLAVHDIKDQFMLGPALMVCPVTKPMYYEAGSRELSGGERTRQVYLPRGTDWVDFWNGRKHRGGQTITTPAPLEIVPLFARAGSVLPVGPDVQHAGEQPLDAVELLVFPGADGALDWYEDAGEGHGYEAGEFSVIPLRWDDTARTLTVGSRRGGFTGMASRRSIRVLRIGGGKGAQPGADWLAADRSRAEMLVENDAMIQYDGDTIGIKLK